MDAKSDSDGSGILTVKNIVLVYEYTITGEHSDPEKSVNKKGDLYFNIGKIIYNDNSEELIDMTTSMADVPPNSLKITEITTSNNNFSLNGVIDNPSSGSVLGVISLGRSIFSESENNQVLTISNDQLSLDTELTLGDTDFASILVINHDELIDKRSEQTGLAAALIAVP